MSYELAQVSGDLFSLETWERIGKFLAVNVATGIVVALVLYLIMTYFIDVSGIGAVVLAILTVLVCNAFMLSVYERWRSCSFPKK